MYYKLPRYFMHQRVLVPSSFKDKSSLQVTFLTSSGSRIYPMSIIFIHCQKWGHFHFAASGWQRVAQDKPVDPCLRQKVSRIDNFMFLSGACCLVTCFVGAPTSVCPECMSRSGFTRICNSEWDMMQRADLLRRWTSCQPSEEIECFQ